MKKIAKIILIIAALPEVLPLRYFIVTMFISYIHRGQYPPIDVIVGIFIGTFVVSVISLIYHLQTLKLYINFKQKPINLLDEELFINKQTFDKSFKIAPLLWLSTVLFSIHYLLLSLLAFDLFKRSLDYGQLLAIPLFFLGLGSLGDLGFVYQKLNE